MKTEKSSDNSIQEKAKFFENERYSPLKEAVTPIKLESECYDKCNPFEKNVILEEHPINQPIDLSLPRSPKALVNNLTATTSKSMCTNLSLNNINIMLDDSSTTALTNKNNLDFLKYSYYEEIMLLIFEEIINNLQDDIFRKFGQHFPRHHNEELYKIYKIVIKNLIQKNITPSMHCILFRIKIRLINLASHLLEYIDDIVVLCYIIVETEWLEYKLLSILNDVLNGKVFWEEAFYLYFSSYKPSVRPLLSRRLDLESLIVYQQRCLAMINGIKNEMGCVTFNLAMNLTNN